MAELIMDVHCRFGATPLVPNWGDAAAVRAALRARGITTAIAASDLAARYDTIGGNDALAQAITAPVAPGDVDLRGWLVLHPYRDNDANGQLRRHFYGSDRFVGAALYADSLTGAHITFAEAQEVIVTYRRYARPLLIETRSALAMREVVRIAQEVGNQIKVIASGMGGDEWRDAVEIAVKPLNMYLDISGVLCPDKIEYALNVLGGARRLLFASNAPNIDPAAVIRMLDDVPGLSADDRERILSGNALRLFGMVQDDGTPREPTEPTAAPDNRPRTGNLAPLRPMQ